MIYLAIAALIVAGDQLFKHWIVQNVQMGGRFELIPGVVHLTYVQNTGAAFSIFSDMRWILFGVTCLCIVLVLMALAKMKINTLGRIGLAFVLGGAIGNAVDRGVSGYVVDMFQADFVKFAVFNVADCFIVVGGIIFVLVVLFAAKPGEKKKRRHKKGGRTAEIKAEPADEADEKDWTETKILEEYELNKLMSDENDSDKKDG